ncbi:hypothetical protein A20C1_00275 [marine actinobacterium PHSC20C1]|nr:hypothetical protein A20C1_00275 [marine actinobacterium PHSC20C1]
MFRSATLAGIAGAVVAQMVVGFAEVEHRLLFVAIAVVSTLFSVGAEQLLRKRDLGKAAIKDDYEEGRLTQFRSAMRGALAPIAIFSADVATAKSSGLDSKDVILGRMSQAIVDAIVRIVGNQSEATLRSAYYAFGHDSNGDYLERKTFSGRSGSDPRQFFRAGTRDGNHLIKLTREDKIVFVPDVSESHVTPTNPGEYAAVIACSITAGERPFGILTVDSPDAGELTEDDKQLILVIARLFAAALAQSPTLPALSGYSAILEANERGEQDHG